MKLLPTIAFIEWPVWLLHNSPGMSIRSAMTTIRVRLITPFATIQKAVDTMSTGDSCFIRAGSYHENIVLQNTQNLYFGSYQNERVVLDGTKAVQGMEQP